MIEWLNFLVGMATLLSIYCIAALAYNVQYGYTRLINFGTVAWFAIGAYTYAILTIPPPLPEETYMFGFGFPIIVGVIGAGVISMLAAFLIGVPTLKLKGHYFAIVTFAFAEIMRHILSNEKWLTNGTVGFFALRRPWADSMSPTTYTYFSFFLMVVVLLITYFLLEKICKAPFGRTLKGIRENDNVCLSLGKKVPSFRMKTFLITSFFIGIAGSLYASIYMTLVTPGIFNSMITFLILFAVVVGGKGNNKGVILGMFLLIFADQFTRFIEVPVSFATRMSGIRAMIYGLLLVIVLRFLPQGIIKEKKVIYNEDR